MQGRARDGAGHNHRPHEGLSLGQGHCSGHQLGGAATTNLHQGQPQHGRGSGALRHFAHALHRWGGQGVSSTEGHP
jgi:hypothetical protein